MADNKIIILTILNLEDRFVNLQGVLYNLAIQEQSHVDKQSGD